MLFTHFNIHYTGKMERSRKFEKADFSDVKDKYNVQTNVPFVINVPISVAILKTIHRSTTVQQ